MVGVVFWLLLLLAIYSYFLYPALLVLANGWSRRRAVSTDASLSVTMIITAFNEQSRIRDKIENALGAQ